MAKKVEGFVKLQIAAGKANPAPPVGPALGQHGVNIMDFCKQFNARTQDQAADGMIIPVVITVYADKSDVSGREFYAAQAYHAEDTVTFTIRWRDELKDTWRVKHGGVIYEINEINHLGYMQDFMRLKCKALAGQGGAA